MANIKEGSFLVVENAGTKYRYSGANLRADVNEWITAAGGGAPGTYPGLKLAGTCAR